MRLDSFYLLVLTQIYCMKQFTLFILLFFSLNGFSQDVTEMVLEESCDCVTKYQKKVRNYEEYLGMIMECMGTNMYAHAEELGDEMGIDVDSPNGMEAIGERMGEHMALECPKFMEYTIQMLGDDQEFREEAIQNMIDEDEQVDETYEEELFIYETGRITEISQTIPCTITLVNEDEESIKVMWLYRLAIDEEYVQNPNKLINKNVSIEYMFDDVYDPSKGAYSSKKVLFDLIIIE